MKPEDAEKLILSKFDENDPNQHIMKVLFGMGMYCAFRGSTEHSMMTVAQVSIGSYPLSHPAENLRGRRKVSIRMNNEKAHKLSVHNNYTRDVRALEFPVFEADPNDFGAAVLRLVEKLDPSQKRLYCYPHKDAIPTGIWDPHAPPTLPHSVFQPLKPMGENKIAKLFKEGAKILGLPASFKPHSLRGYCITKLANNVSLKATMEVARHSSAAASAGYMQTSEETDVKRLKALGYNVGECARAIPEFKTEEKAIGEKRKIETPEWESPMKMEETPAEVPSSSAKCLMQAKEELLAIENELEPPRRIRMSDPTSDSGMHRALRNQIAALRIQLKKRHDDKCYTDMIIERLQHEKRDLQRQVEDLRDQLTDTMMETQRYKSPDFFDKRGGRRGSGGSSGYSRRSSGGGGYGNYYNTPY